MNRRESVLGDVMPAPPKYHNWHLTTDDDGDVMLKLRILIFTVAYEWVQSELGGYVSMAEVEEADIVKAANKLLKPFKESPAIAAKAKSVKEFVKG